MGLLVTCGAFQGSYGTFHHWRKAICEATGGVWGEGSFFTGHGYSRTTHPGLWELLTHSDCDGEIQPENAAIIATELENLLPRLKEENKYLTHRFINGCRFAASSGKPLEFM